MKLRAKKGFTLVELLIVIVIIGILVGAMLLSSGGATASAKASAALSELRGLKGAVVLYQTDNIGAVPPDLDALSTKMDNVEKIKTGLYRYGYTTNADNTRNYYVGVLVSADVKAKLVNQEVSAGISFDMGGITFLNGGITAATAGTGDSVVTMIASKQ